MTETDHTLSKNQRQYQKSLRKQHYLKVTLLTADYDAISSHAFHRVVSKATLLKEIIQEWLAKQEKP